MILRHYCHCPRHVTHGRSSHLNYEPMRGHLHSVRVWGCVWGCEGVSGRTWFISVLVIDTIVNKCCVVSDRDNCHRIWYFWSNVKPVRLVWRGPNDTVFWLDEGRYTDSGWPSVLSISFFVSSDFPEALNEYVENLCCFIRNPHPGKTRLRQPPLLISPKQTGLTGLTSPSVVSHCPSRCSSRFQACKQDNRSRTISTIVLGPVCGGWEEGH